MEKSLSNEVALTCLINLRAFTYYTVPQSHKIQIYQLWTSQLFSSTTLWMIIWFHAFSSNFNATVTTDADAWSGYMPDAPQSDMNQNCLSHAGSSM